MSDLARYRLRAFEFSFVEPILDYLNRHPDQEQELVDTMIWNILLKGSDESIWTEHPSRGTGGLVHACLLAEASEWIRWGTELGYFSSEIRPQPLPFGGVDLRSSPITKNLPLSQSRPQRDSQISHRDFGRELNLAIESLDAQRVELLRLLYFSDKMEWDSALDGVYGLASRVEQGAEISSAQIDQVSWAFFDINEEPPPSGSPRDWRSLLVRRSDLLPRLTGLLAAASSLVAAVAVSDPPSGAAQEALDEDFVESHDWNPPPWTSL